MNNQLLIEARIKYDTEFCEMCLLRLYREQTADEQDSANSHHENGRGFNRADAKALTFYAETLINDGKGILYSFDHEDVSIRLLKYSKQLSILLTQEEIED